MLPILYQDEHIVIIDKPSGLLVHRSLIDKRETRFAFANDTRSNRAICLSGASFG